MIFFLFSKMVKPNDKGGMNERENGLFQKAPSISFEKQTAQGSRRW
jgi:hypothetical protein